MVGQDGQNVAVGGRERRPGGTGKFQQHLVRDLQPFQLVPGFGELGGEPLDTVAGRVTVVGQAAQELVGDRRRPAGHAAALEAGDGVSRQRVAVPVSRRVIRSVAAQYRWDWLLAGSFS